MKRLALLLALGLALVGCGNKATEEVKGDGPIKVGATVSYTEILEYAEGILEEEGIDIDVVEFNDYLTPNLALDDGSIDINYFQHRPYFEDNIEANGLDLVGLEALYFGPLALYSDKIQSIDDLADGAEIFLPNDPTNEARALILLEKNGLIKLKDPTDVKATAKDVIENPKNLKFTALDAASIPSALKDADAAIINFNYALANGLSAKNDSLIIEGKDTPYANIVAVRAGDETKEEVVRLMEVLKSEEVQKFVEEEFDGELVPAF